MIGMIDVHHIADIFRRALRRHMGGQMPLMEDNIIALPGERTIAGIAATGHAAHEFLVVS